MNVFQYLPVVSHINDVDIQVIEAQESNTSTTNPNLNPNQAASSSSFSLSRSLKFLVEFIINGDSVPQAVSNVHGIEPRPTRSNTLSIDPGLASSRVWVQARIELCKAGLEALFIEDVVNALQARVYEILCNFLTNHNGCGQASVHLRVNVKRASIVPVLDPFGHLRWITRVPPVPLDQEIPWMETLERVKAEEEESLKDMSCAICLEELRVFGDQKQVKETGLVRLRCKHTFHHGCIQPWFKKTHSCPLCRSKLLAASNYLLRLTP